MPGDLQLPPKGRQLAGGGGRFFTPYLFWANKKKKRVRKAAVMHRWCSTSLPLVVQRLKNRSSSKMCNNSSLGLFPHTLTGNFSCLVSSLSYCLGWLRGIELHSISPHSRKNNSNQTIMWWFSGFLTQDGKLFLSLPIHFVFICDLGSRLKRLSSKTTVTLLSLLSLWCCSHPFGL